MSCRSAPSPIPLAARLAGASYANRCLSRLTSPARTVADCFAYRTTVGLEVALEALRDCLRQRRAAVDELHRAAQARRMANVMRPYLEALA